jgi:hypothetical protein
MLNILRVHVDISEDITHALAHELPLSTNIPLSLVVTSHRPIVNKFVNQFVNYITTTRSPVVCVEFYCCGTVDKLIEPSQIALVHAIKIIDVVRIKMDERIGQIIFKIYASPILNLFYMPDQTSSFETMCLNCLLMSSTSRIVTFSFVFIDKLRLAQFSFTGV